MQSRILQKGKHRITQGFGVTIAQTFGARQYDRLKHLVATAIMMTLVVSLALSIPALTFCRHFLRMMSTPQDIIDSADSYLRVMFAGIIFCMSYNVAASILRAIGDSKSPLYFLIIWRLHWRKDARSSEDALSAC